MKKLGFIACCLSVGFFWNSLGAQADQVATTPLLADPAPVHWPQPELSPNDKRSVEYFVLPNKLPVLLISDPKAEKAAAAMDVYVGSGDDPMARQGLAHFLEHMLFLGTQKYPDPEDYQAFIQQHGGSHNAYTSIDHTNYFFDISADQLVGGLDRFAQFFIAPLFNEDYVDRERNAVHSEFSAKFTSEYYRQEDVLRTLAPDDHPLSHFRTGNLDTLHNKNGDLRNALLGFYGQHYSANNMRLVVVGKESIADLKKLVTPLFAEIKNFNAVPAVVTASMYRPDLLPASVNIVPYTDIRTVSYIFPTPKNTDWMEKPLGYLSFFLGHEGEGSLLWLLQQQGWAESLGASQGFSWRGGESLAVTIGLTPEGLTKLDQIESLLFAYIHKVQQQGIEKWRFDELKNLGEMDFNFKERGAAINEASRIASLMQEVQSPFLFSVDNRLGDYKPELIKKLASYLTPQNVLRIVTAPSVKTEQKTALYGTPYWLQADYSPILNAAEELQKQLALPLKNPFIPERFTLIKGHDAIPQTLIKSPRFNAMHATNTQFDVPKAIVRVRLKSALVEQSPAQAAMAAVLAEAISADLNPVTYQAAMAGANFNVTATARGLDFSFSGYSDSLKPLLDYSLNNIRLYAKKQGVVTDLAKLESFRQALVRQYRNEKRQTPYRQLMGDLAATIYQPYWSSQVMADALEQLDLTQLPTFVHRLLQQSEVTSLSAGNLSSRTAKKLAKQLRKVLVQGRAFKSQTEARVVQISDTRALDVAAQHQDNAVMLYFQGQQHGQEPADGVAEQARLKMLGQMLSTPFYAELRTQQQLGYIVFGSYYPVRAMPGLVFLVQSPETPIDNIYRAMTQFLSTYQPDFSAQFHMHQLALVGELSEAPKNLGELTGRYWQDLNEGNVQFDHDQQLQRAIEALNPKDFELWYRTFITQSLAKKLVIYSQKPSSGATKAQPKGLLETLPRLDPSVKTALYRYP